MGFYNSPRIVTDNLVLNLDAGNIKSYAGDTATPAAPAYGYVGGGSTPTASSVVDRIDYGNDTATAAVKGPLSVARIISAAAGNASYAYFGGGSNPQISTVERIDYSNDTPTAAVKGPLAAARNYHTATGNASYGYFAGGDPGPKSIIQRIDYSNDTATAASGKGPLSSARNYLGATGNQSYGYFAAGADPNTSTIDRLDYSSDTTTAAVKGPLTSIRRQLSATGNASYGYFGGGRSGPGASQVTTVDRVDYSSDTPTASPKGPLTLVSYWGAATGSSSYGYFALGGGPDPYYLSLVDRIDYSSDTPTATAKGPLSAGRRGIAAASGLENGLPNSATYAYRSISTSQGTDYGYFAAGYHSHISTIERIDFDNDTATALTKGNLSNPNYGAGGTGNTSYAYWGGGRDPLGAGSNKTWMDRTDYSNDTATAVAKGPLSAARYQVGATGSADYGYFMGGSGPGSKSTVDRLDYSSDSTAAAVKGPLTIARYMTYGTGTQSYGYCFGGQAASPTYTVTTVDRIDYSSDTPTTVAKGPLTQKRFAMGSTGNASYAWSAGGRKYDGSGANFSTVDRLDYSSDTSTTSPKGPLAAVRYGVGATGNTSYGYFGGGAPAMSSLTTIDRIDYSNDTPTATAKGYLNPGSNNDLTATSSRAYALPTSSTIYPWYDTSGKGDDGQNTSGGASFSNAGGGSFTFNGTSDYVSSDDKANLQLGSGEFTLAAWIRPSASPAGTDYGYMGGGYPGVSSLIDRIDYSNDTPTATAKGPLAAGRKYLPATGNTSYGYWLGGKDPSDETSTVQRLDYSSDTTVASKGPLVAAVYRNMAAVTNNTYGYTAGGNAPYTSSRVQRIEYSNDTATAVDKGPLTATNYLLSGTGNQSYGYIGGGSPGPKSSVDRIDYSSDTSTAASKGPLTYARRKLQATGNASYGWFSGGTNPGPDTTIVDRIDYSNDTATATAKGPLSVSRTNMGATGNTSYGYWMGGGSKSTVDRIDYSNDTPTAAVKGPLNSTSFNAGGAASSRECALPTTARSDNQGIISYSDTAGEENDTTCQLDVNSDGKIKFSGAAGIVTSTSAPTVDTWSHAAVTRTDNTISLYINGVLENSGITTHTFSDYAKVTIGANRPRSTFYKGDISQVQIYKKALSSDQIQQNFRSVKKRFGL